VTATLENCISKTPHELQNRAALRNGRFSRYCSRQPDTRTFGKETTAIWRVVELHF
jgi:hypothetical protein